MHKSRYNTLPPAITTVVHVHASFFLLAQSLHPPNHPQLYLKCYFFGLYTSNYKPNLCIFYTKWWKLTGKKNSKIKFSRESLKILIFLAFDSPYPAFTNAQLALRQGWQMCVVRSEESKRFVLSGQLAPHNQEFSE